MRELERRYLAQITSASDTLNTMRMLNSSCNDTSTLSCTGVLYET